MVDLANEIPLTLRAAAKLPQLRRNGRAPHIASLYRWVMSGCRGIRLDSAIVAGTRCTTSEAVDRWIAALTAAANGETTVPAPRSPLRRLRESAQANRNLERSNW